MVLSAGMAVQFFLPAKAAGVSASLDGWPVSQTVMPVLGLIPDDVAPSAPRPMFPQVSRNETMPITKGQRIGTSFIGVANRFAFYGSERRFYPMGPESQGSDAGARPVRVHDAFILRFPGQWSCPWLPIAGQCRGFPSR